MEVLQEAFQAATQVGDLKSRAVIFEMLLTKGVRGEVVDEQLASAARYGEAGNGVLRVLLDAGADPNFGGGEAVCAAVRSAFLENLELLLGRVVRHENQVSYRQILEQRWGMCTMLTKEIEEAERRDAFERVEGELEAQPGDKADDGGVAFRGGAGGFGGDASYACGTC